MYPQFTIKPIQDDTSGIGQYESTQNKRRTQLLQPTYQFEALAYSNKTALRLYPQYSLDQALHEVECFYPGVMDEDLRGRYPLNEPSAQYQIDDVLSRDLGFPAAPPLPSSDIQRNPLYTPSQQQQLINQQTNLKPIFSQSRKRWINPLKQPSIYSQYTPLCHEQHCKSSSTSSIYCSIAQKPSIAELITGTGKLLFTQIVQHQQPLHQSIMPGCARLISLFEESTYQTQSEHITEPKQCEAFIKHIFDMGQFQPETCIVTLIFLHRFISRTGITLYSGNWKPIYIISLILSQKICDDTPLINKDFGIIYPPLNITSINILERSMVTQIEFDLHVTSACYLSYYDEVKLVSRQSDLRRDLFQKQFSLWTQVNIATRHAHDPDVKRLLTTCRQQNRPLPDLDYSDEYRSIYYSKYDFIPPLLGRVDQQRLSFTELYSYQRAIWKAKTMTPEFLKLADDKYKIQS